MDLALSLGDSAMPPFTFLDKATKISSKDLGFGIALEGDLNAKVSSIRVIDTDDASEAGKRISSDPYLQLDLLPLSPVPPTRQASSHLPMPWLTDSMAAAERVSFDRLTRGLHVSRSSATRTKDATLLSPNSAVSSLQMEFCVRSTGGNVDRGNRDHEMDDERARSSAVSDDDENGSNRKKFRLSKQQSAYLEESFKEHTTLNPKQKLALTKQLNLRPRQVEVWFQNRRTRTKLKQTEVDCDYLKRCCETLTEENRRLQKELQDLRALKTSQPFYMKLPATTLTMCPSCERVAHSSSLSVVTATGNTTNRTQPSNRMTMATSMSNSA